MRDTKGPVYYWQDDPPPPKPKTSLIIAAGLSVLALALVIIWLPLLKPQTHPPSQSTPVASKTQIAIPGKQLSIVERVSAALLFSTPGTTPISGPGKTTPSPTTPQPQKTLPVLPNPIPKGP